MRTGLVCVAAGLLAVAAAASDGPLHPQLHPLRAFVGKSYRGEFTDAASGKRMVDVQRWERALNGQAIRILHSLNDGEYGGETLLFWDEKEQGLVYYYFTTAGFYTHGTMKVRPGVFEAHEYVEGSEDGTTEVRTTGRILEDGRIQNTAEYLRNGEWVPGHEVTYAEAPAAEVVFR